MILRKLATIAALTAGGYWLKKKLGPATTAGEGRLRETGAWRDSVAGAASGDGSGARTTDAATPGAASTGAGVR